MENAVKALLIAAGVLIGVMIISLGVSLYSSLRQYAESVEENVANKELQQFNQQFTKYINCNQITDEVNFVLTIQDIVTAANIAYQNNNEYGITDYVGNNYYVIVNLDGNSIEKTVNTNSATILANAITKQYKCSINDVKFNTVTGRVYEVNFHEI